MSHRFIGTGGIALALLVGLCLVAAADAGAQSPGGSGTLKGNGALAVQRCGQDQLRASATVIVLPDGTWSAISSEGAGFAGTWTALDTSGRKLDLAFDASSEAGFVSSLANDAAELCRTSIEVTSVQKKKFLLKINRPGTRAKLVLRYTATGTGNGRSGWARSGLTLAGRWTAG